MPCWLPRIYVMPVVWAGVLIVLSWCCFAIDKPRWGVGLGIASLFVRELALPYCAVGVALALLTDVGERRGYGWRDSWHTVYFTLGTCSKFCRLSVRMIVLMPRVGFNWRRGVCDFTGPDERLSAALAAVGDGHCFATRDVGLRRLEHRRWPLRGVYVLRVFDFVQLRRSAFQSIPGLSFAPLLCLVLPSPAALGHCSRRSLRETSIV